jgi:hypothetical protein
MSILAMDISEMGISEMTSSKDIGIQICPFPICPFYDKPPFLSDPLWQMPHLKAHFEKFLTFYKNFRPKFSRLKANFEIIFSFNICHWNSSLALRSKNYFRIT